MRPSAQTAAQKPAQPASSAPPSPTSTPEPRSAEGQDLVEVVKSYLHGQNKSVPSATLAGQAGLQTKRGITLVEALLVADGLERESRGLRPRFVQHKSGWALAEREVSNEIFGLERQVADAQKRLAQLAERQVLRKLRTLPMGAFVQVMAVHLHRSGFGAMMPVSRGTEKEFHLSVLDRRRGGRFRTAVVLVQASSNDAIKERAVMDLRGSLHHYDATSGMIATTGNVSAAARDEAMVANLPPVALVDGEMLAREMVRLGIGVCERRMSLAAYDETFFSSLGT